MTYPIPGVGISTPYGKRGPYWSCNDNGSGGVHTGVDFACSSGTDILAPIAGDIRHRSYGSAFGSHQFAISPDDDEPFGAGEVFFAHTTSRLADGTRVAVGDKIADVGAEGNVSGPHLHMEYHSDTKGVWSCYVHDDPQPVLDYEPAPANPSNPNGVGVGDTVIVTANGSLNGRDAPSSAGAVVKTRPKGDTFVITQLVDGWAAE
jgi:murein DD-endopeptidase MepM/ murein hydrolase activator NlpD